MVKIYNDILFDEYGQSVPLTTDDFIEYLTHQIHELRLERDDLEKKLDEIRSILTLKNDKDDF